MPILWPGFLKGLLQDAGCTLPESSTFGAIHATYTQDGRPAKLQIDTSTLSPACSNVIEALARVILAEPTQRPLGPLGEWVLVPMQASYLACASEPAPPDPEPAVRVAGADGIIKQPKKTRDQPPEYPPAMINARVQGTVVLESTLSAAGCVSGLRVLRGVHPALDAAAIRAVTRWQFTPTELDGKPVPVILTVTVNFTLR